MDETVDAKQAKRFKYLEAAYQETGGDRSAIFGKVELGKKLGLDDSEAMQIARYLCDEGLLRSLGPDAGLITHQGIREVEAAFRSPGAPGMPPKQPATHRGLSVFISHSSKDADLALALIDLLKAGLGLFADQIRCSSVDGYRLPVGVNTEDKLREEVNAAKVVVGLITPSSLASYYVMFELGARWGADLFLAPLLAGVKPSDLSGPLSLLNALDATNDAQLHQLLTDVSKQLSLPLQNAASFVRHVAAVKALADGISGHGASLSHVESERSQKPSKPAIEKQKAKVVYLWPDEMGIWHISSKEHGRIGMILPFYYNPTKSAAKTELYVRAHVVFKDKVSGTTKRISAACWLDEDLNKVTLKPGDEKAVVLLVVDREGQPYAMHCMREEVEYLAEIGTSKVREYPLSLEEKTVDVVLLSADDEIEYQEVFSVDLPNLKALNALGTL